MPNRTALINKRMQAAREQAAMTNVKKPAGMSGVAGGVRTLGKYPDIGSAGGAVPPVSAPATGGAPAPQRGGLISGITSLFGLGNGPYAATPFSKSPNANPDFAGEKGQLPYLNDTKAGQRANSEYNKSLIAERERLQQLRDQTKFDTDEKIRLEKAQQEGKTAGEIAVKKTPTPIEEQVVREKGKTEDSTVKRTNAENDAATVDANLKKENAKAMKDLQMEKEKLGVKKEAFVPIGQGGMMDVSGGDPTKAGGVGDINGVVTPYHTHDTKIKHEASPQLDANGKLIGMTPASEEIKQTTVNPGVIQRMQITPEDLQSLPSRMPQGNAPLQNTPPYSPIQPPTPMDGGMQAPIGGMQVAPGEMQGPVQPVQPTTGPNVLNPLDMSGLIEWFKRFGDGTKW